MKLLNIFHFLSKQTKQIVPVFFYAVYNGDSMVFFINFKTRRPLFLLGWMDLRERLGTVNPSPFNGIDLPFIEPTDVKPFQFKQKANFRLGVRFA